VIKHLSAILCFRRLGSPAVRSALLVKPRYRCGAPGGLALPLEKSNTPATADSKFNCGIEVNQLCSRVIHRCRAFFNFFSMMTKNLVFTLILILLTDLARSQNAYPVQESDILKHLAAGNQQNAEKLLADTLEEDSQLFSLYFWNGVLARSRFSVRDSAPYFFVTASKFGDTPEGQAAACILGLDFSVEQRSALYYYNALLLLAAQNPRSVPIRLMAAVMARTLTRSNKFGLEGERKTRILLSGVREYEAVLTLLEPGTGPVLVHQTFGNILDDLEAYDRAVAHKLTAVKLERKEWSLHAAAWSMYSAGLYSEALPLAQEAIALDPSNENYHWTSANILWALGRPTEALAAWELASQLNPEKREPFNLGVRGYRFLGNYSAARLLAKRWLENNPEDRVFKIWEARLAVMLGEPGAAQRLFAAGEFDFNGNPRDCKPSKNPWFLAVESGDLPAVRRLLSQGANVNASSAESYDQTALMKAVLLGWEPIVVELLRAGAEVDALDRNKNTALHYSAQFNQPRVMQLLLDAGAQLDLQDRWSQTPLTTCAGGRHWEVFNLLIEEGANIHLATPHGGTPLHYACGWGHLPIVRKLIELGADVNFPMPKTGATPLIAACREWAHANVVPDLIKAGAKINAADNEGRTALHHAIDPLMNKPLVDLLLEGGANPLQTDSTGVTAITQARLLGFEETARAMEKRVGREERLVFPRFELADKTLSAADKNASLFMLPILLAQGHPLGRPSGVPPGDARAAKNELERMFGIKNAGDLEAEIKALTDFEPSQRLLAGELSEKIKSDALRTLLLDATRKIQRSVLLGDQQEIAWIQTHLIYLADLGISAGFLSAAEGSKRILAASLKISSSFNSWEEFFQSFNAGASFHNGWEASRYKNISTLIERERIPWPRQT
jgi:ankyrin repeat protein